MMLPYLLRKANKKPNRRRLNISNKWIPYFPTIHFFIPQFSAIFVYINKISCKFNFRFLSISRCFISIYKQVGTISIYNCNMKMGFVLPKSIPKIWYCIDL